MATAVMKFDPFRELTNIQNRINQLFREAFPTFGDEALTPSAWTPAADIFESPQAIELTVELPGVNKDDVHVSVTNNQLTISGERKLPYADKRENYHRVERSYGSFTRSFTVPANVDVNNISANYKDGILCLILPKKPEAQPRQIKVN
jgi:HSP20 family protein